MVVSNRNLLFKGSIFRCYVSFRKGTWKFSEVKGFLMFFAIIKSKVLQDFPPVFALRICFLEVWVQDNCVLSPRNQRWGSGNRGGWNGDPRRSSGKVDGLGFILLGNHLFLKLMVEDFWQLLMKVVPETFRTGANHLHGAIIKIGIFSLCYSTQWKWNHDPDLESESHPCSTFSGHMKTIQPNSKCHQATLSQRRYSHTSPSNTWP